MPYALRLTTYAFYNLTSTLLLGLTVFAITEYAKVKTTSIQRH
jgi:hypothetical protein